MPYYFVGSPYYSPYRAGYYSYAYRPWRAYGWYRPYWSSYYWASRDEEGTTGLQEGAAAVETQMSDADMQAMMAEAVRQTNGQEGETMAMLKMLAANDDEVDHAEMPKCMQMHMEAVCGSMKNKEDAEKCMKRYEDACELICRDICSLRTNGGAGNQ